MIDFGSAVLLGFGFLTTQSISMVSCWKTFLHFSSGVDLEVSSVSGPNPSLLFVKIGSLA